MSEGSGSINNVGVKALENPSRERWQILCEQIAQERDSECMMRLIEELNQLLQAREERAGPEPENAAGPIGMLLEIVPHRAACIRSAAPIVLMHHLCSRWSTTPIELEQP